jgi:hypothetical protein
MRMAAVGSGTRLGVDGPRLRRFTLRINFGVSGLRTRPPRPEDFEEDSDRYALLKAPDRRS